MDKKQTLFLIKWPRFALLIISFSLLFLYTSCSIGPNYVKPPYYPEKTSSGKNQFNDKSLEKLAFSKNWWEIYHDKVLNSLEREFRQKEMYYSLKHS